MLFEEYRVQALINTINPSVEHLAMRMRRWYSKTHHTPLAQVYNIPDEEVFQAFFDERAENFEPKEIEEEKVSLLNVDGPKEEIKKEDVEDELFFQKALKEMDKKETPVIIPDIKETKPPIVLPPDIKMEFPIDDF